MDLSKNNTLEKSYTPRVSVKVVKHRPNKQGEFPVVVVCSYGGTKELYTGVYLPLDGWDSAKNKVKRGVEGAAAKTERILERFNDGVQFINELKANGLTIGESKTRVEKKQPVNITIKSVLNDYLRENRQLKDETIQNYCLAIKRLLKANGIQPPKTPTDKYTTPTDWLLRKVGDMNVSDITKESLDNLVYQDTADHHSENSTNQRLNCLLTLQKHAAENGWCVPLYYNRKKHKQLKRKYHHIHLTTAQVQAVLNYLLKTLRAERKRLETDGIGAFYNLINSDIVYRSLVYWLLMVFFQGLSPVDFFKLKRKDLKQNTKAYFFKIERQKTKIPVTITLPYDNPLYNMFFVPFLNLCESDNDLIFGWRWHSNSCNRLNAAVREGWRRVNEFMEDEANAIDKFYPIDETYTLYSARHSNAQISVQEGVMSAEDMSNQQGRSLALVGTYVSEFEDEERAADLQMGFYNAVAKNIVETAQRDTTAEFIEKFKKRAFINK